MRGLHLDIFQTELQVCKNVRINFNGLELLYCDTAFLGHLLVPHWICIFNC